jgi:hypothetical protein
VFLEIEIAEIAERHERRRRIGRRLERERAVLDLGAELIAELARFHTPRRLGASLNSPSQTLPGRHHGQPNRREFAAAISA